jgi:hypothetical protein
MPKEPAKIVENESDTSDFEVFFERYTRRHKKRFEQLREEW